MRRVDPTRQRFKAKVETAGRGGHFITVRRRVAARFARKALTPVRGTVNGVAYRSSIFPRGDGSFYIVLNKALREAAGITAGDVVDVIMELDTAAREVEVPADLARGLRRNAAARAFWQRLAYSHRREYVTWILEAKREETRRQRVEKTLAMLAAGQREAR